MAMVQFSSGKTDEAHASLTRAIRGFGVIGDRRLVSEAASMISPATTQPVARPSSAEFNATSAIDAQMLAALEPCVGQTVTIKGFVARAAPTYSAGHLNIFLQPAGNGVLLWIPHDFLSNFEPAFFDDIAGSQVVATGTLVHYTQTSGTWRGDLEIEIDNPSQITFFDPRLNGWPVVASIASAQPTVRPQPSIGPMLTDVDANNVQKLIDLEDSDARVHGTVTSTHLTAAQNALVLSLGDSKKGFSVFVPPGIFPEFDALFDGHSADALKDRQVIVTGTIIDYNGTPEIKLVRTSNLQLVQNNPTSAPATQPGR